MIKIFIPSKNRPQQLRLLLLSIKKFFPLDLVNSINIYYVSTNDRYQLGYEKLQNEVKCDKFIWTKQKTVKEDIEHFLSLGHEYTLLITDDSIFYGLVHNLEFVLKQLENPTNLAFSFRLGQNTQIIDYTNKNSLEAPLDLTEPVADNIMRWNWLKHKNGHFGFPIGLDGTLIKTSILHRLTIDVEHDTYRAWECGLHVLAKRETVLLHNLCYHTSVLVNIPVNQAADALRLNNAIYHNYSLDSLNDLYLDDIVIDLDRLLEREFKTPAVTVQGEYRFPFVSQVKLPEPKKPTTWECIKQIYENIYSSTFR